ncbi:hypothetical protein D3C72_1950250 [compost metagenome]
MSFFDSASAVASTSLPVSLPRTISSSFMTFAGLKKCVPITSCGRLVNAAILSRSKVDVFEARMAPGFMTASSCLNTLSLTPNSSNTASMTMSACAMSAYAKVPETSAMRCSAFSCVSLPFFTVFS